MQTIEIRREDLKNMDLSDFIKKYLLLKTEAGLRCQFKVLKGLKILYCLKNRLKRIKESNKLLIKFHSL